MPELKYVVSGDESGFKKSLKEVEAQSAKTSAKVEKDFDNARKASAKATDGIMSDAKKLQQKGIKLDILKPDPMTGNTGPALNAADIQKHAAANEATARSVEKVVVAKNQEVAATQKVTVAQTAQMRSLQQLTIQLQSYQRIAESSTNPTRLALYNKKVQDTQLEITRLGNIGKTGFDNMGNAIQKSTGGLGGMFTSLKTVAALIPGIGLAGLLAFAVEPILKYVAGLGLFKEKIDAILATKKALSDATLKGSQDAQAEMTALKLQYKAAHDANVPLARRKEIYAQLQKDYPAYFSNISFERSQAGATKTAYDQLTGSILASAKARAYADKITQNETRALSDEDRITQLQAEESKLQAKIDARNARAQNQIRNSTREGAGISDIAAADVLQGKLNDKIKERKNLETDIKILKKQNLALETKATAEIVKGGNVKDLETPKAGPKGNPELTAQKALQEKLDDLHDNAMKKRLSDDEQELETVRLKYKDMRQEVEEYYKRYKVLKVDASKLDADEQAEINAILKKRADEQIKKDAEKFEELLKDHQTYAQKREKIIQESEKNAAKLREEGYYENATQLEEDTKEELAALDEANIKKWESYKTLFDNLENLSRKQTQDGIARLKKDLAEFTGSADAKALILKEIAKLEESLKKDNTKDLLKSADALRDIASSVSEVNKGMGQLLYTVANTVTSYARLNKAAKVLADTTASTGDKQTAMLDVITQGVSGLIQVISTITNASKQRKEAEEAYYRSVIEGQREYNLSLNDEIRLRSELEENVFLKDSKGRILSGTKALVDANQKYLQSIQDLSKGEAKIGQRNAVDWGSVGKAAGGGAAVGAAIGSVVPVIGTLIGGAVGAVAGAISGLFGGKKKKDVFGSLLQEYPELVLKAKDGTLKVNEALAKSLVAQNLVNDATKDLINNTLAWGEKVEAAQEQIKGVIADLAGGLGNDLRNSLVQAFKDGSDAAKAFGDDVSKVVEGIVSQFLFNELFSKNFETLQKEMQASYGLGGDQSLVDDLSRFYSDAGPKIGEFQQALEAARTEAEKMGFDIFKKDIASAGSSNSSNTVAGAVSAIRAEQADLIGARLGGIQVSSLETLAQMKLQTGYNAQCVDLAMQNLNIALKIEQNTFRTANNTDALKDIRTGIQSMDKKISASVNAGLGLNGLGG